MAGLDPDPQLEATSVASSPFNLCAPQPHGLTPEDFSILSLLTSELHGRRAGPRHRPTPNPWLSPQNPTGPVHPLTPRGMAGPVVPIPPPLARDSFD